MSQLLIQADDNGITAGVVEGIHQTIQAGTVRSTGLFTNRRWAARAAKQLRDRRDISLGIDLNLVTGQPLSETGTVPALVDESGVFISSTRRIDDNTIVSVDGFMTTFEQEPLPLEQVRSELTLQLKEFRHLVGREPDYIHYHSLCTPTIVSVAEELSDETGAPISTDLYALDGVRPLPSTWYTRPFSLEQQVASDPYQAICAAVSDLGADETGVLICHPGLVDSELLDLSTFSVVRARDLAALTDPRLLERLADTGVDLVSYAEVVATV